MSDDHEAKTRRRAQLRLALRIDQSPAAAAWFDSLSADAVAGLYETCYCSYHHSMVRPDLVVDPAAGAAGEPATLAEVLRDLAAEIKAAIRRKPGLKKHGGTVLDVLLGGRYAQPDPPAAAAGPDGDPRAPPADDDAIVRAFYQEVANQTGISDLRKAEKLARDAFKTMFRSLESDTERA